MTFYTGSAFGMQAIGAGTEWADWATAHPGKKSGCAVRIAHPRNTRGVDPGGAGGAAAPPILILVVQTYHFAPPIIPVHK